MHGLLTQSLTRRESLTLERSHRLCRKQMHGLHIRSRTDAALGLICVLPIQAEIEKRKLTLFGQLCRLERDWTVQQNKFSFCVYVHIIMVI